MLLLHRCVHCTWLDQACWLWMTLHTIGLVAQVRYRAATASWRKRFGGPGKSWKSPGLFSKQVSGNPTDTALPTDIWWCDWCPCSVMMMMMMMRCYDHWNQDRNRDHIAELNKIESYFQWFSTVSGIVAAEQALITWPGVFHISAAYERRNKLTMHW